MSDSEAMTHVTFEQYADMTEDERDAVALAELAHQLLNDKLNSTLKRGEPAEFKRRVDELTKSFGSAKAQKA
ncbi:MAG: hypothetical protein AAF890_07335 [Pseudomonadota bacterium]